MHECVSTSMLSSRSCVTLIKIFMLSSYISLTMDQNYNGINAIKGIILNILIIHRSLH